MFIFIDDVLDAAMLSSVRTAAAALSFRDGRATAGWHARTVKANRQAAPSAALKSVQRQLTDALDAHEIVRAAALPARIAPPLVSRYGPGEAYGPHVDDAVMGAPPLRSDVSLTLFLSDPQDYDGGELVAESASGEEAVKLPAGAAAMYASTTLHRVAPVTRGERLVAVTWIQSLVRDPGARAILFDLDRARRAAFAADGPDSPVFPLLAKTYANLLRRWAEP